MPTLIAKVAGPLLSCVTWALLKLLVSTGGHLGSSDHRGKRYTGM